MSGIPRLGKRGEGWVALQGVLILLCVAAGRLGARWPAGIRGPLRVIGIALQIAGGALALAGMLRLGRHLTPFPKPSSGAVVKADGAYRLVRHPIYGGLIVLFLGGSLSSSPLALLPTGALAALFEGKRRVEERWLIEHDPTYDSYRLRVPRAFVPGVW